MQITLKRASMPDCSTIHNMQLEAFKTLLEKYKDNATSPGAVSLENIETRMARSFTDYYFIQLDTSTIGVIRIAQDIKDTCRIAIMFILPEYQGKGYAQQAIKQVELLYPDAKSWALDTIKQEEKLCHLYEKMGYKATGQEEEIHEGMTLKFYAK